RSCSASRPRSSPAGRTRISPSRCRSTPATTSRASSSPRKERGRAGDHAADPAAAVPRGRLRSSGDTQRGERPRGGPLRPARPRGERLRGGPRRPSRPLGKPVRLRKSEYCWLALSYGCRGDAAGRQEASVLAFREWTAPQTAGQRLVTMERWVTMGNGDKSVEI